MNSHQAKLFLAEVPGIGPKTFIKLITQYQDIGQFLNEIINKRFNYEHINPRIIESIRNYYHSGQFSKIINNLNYYQVKYLLLDDKDYPYRLKQIYDPPSVIYYKGELNTQVIEKAIAVVGTRRNTSYGAKATDDIVSGLVQMNYTIVSGMAFGIDSCAHEAAINNGGRTVAVLAGGAERPSPAGNSDLYSRILKNNGLIISEYPPEYKIVPALFPKRSRIISGLCEGVLVIEAGEKSGALIAARIALDQGRDVFALPGSIYSPAAIGTNLIIKSGEAKLVQSVDDVLCDLCNGTLSTVKNIIKYNPLEKSIIDVVSSEPVAIDEIVKKMKMPVSEILSTLSLMEFENKIERNDKGEYFI